MDNDKPNIIFLLDRMFNKRDFDRFGFNILQKRGYNVFAWDCSQLINPEIGNKYTAPDKMEFSTIEIIKSKNNLTASLNKLSKDDFIIDIFGLNNFKPIYKIKSKLVNFSLGSIPNPKMSFLSNLIQKAKYNFFHPKIFIKNIKKLFYKIINNNIMIDYLIIGGSSATLKEKKYRNIIKAHAFDYDYYLSQNKQKDGKTFTIKDNYAVFLDEAVTFHYDFILNDIKPDCDEEIYYKELNKFFDAFEKRTNLEIIIAAHPNMEYAGVTSLYENRKIFIKKTFDLVKNADYVLAHFSTSINFAILHNKPILIIDSVNYNKKFRSYILSLSESLKIKPIDISSKLDFSNIKKDINLEQYEKYKSLHIKEKNTPKKYIWDIFCDYLSNEKTHSNIF